MKFTGNRKNIITGRNCMESKTFKKIIVTALSAAMITSAGVAGAGLVDAFSANSVTASAAEEVTERKDVKVTKVDQAYSTAACFYFDLESSRQGNGTNVNNEAAVGDYIYYNRESCKNAKFDVHMRSNMFWFYAKTGTTLAVGDTITFVKGLHFPVVTNDGVAVSSYQDYLGETVVFEYTESGWVNKTEADKEKEQKVTVTGLGNGVGNGETFKTNQVTTTNVQNYVNVQNWIEVKGYLLLNGEPYNNGGIHMMSGNFYVYPTAGFAIGDTITVLEGLHMPSNPESHWADSAVPSPSYAEQQYSGYISETYTIEYTDAGWVKQAEVGEPNTLKDITAVTENEAGATMPATYSFTMNFDLRVSKTELTELEGNDNYAQNIYIDGKSVKEWNETVSAEDNDGETIPAVSISAYGTGITLTIVKSTGIVKADTNFSVKVAKEFVCSSGNTIEEDITRYYINGLEYWTNILPYEIQKTHALTLKNVGAFEVIDNGVNGVVYFNFNEEIASKQLLAYNFHPAYMKTLPAAYPIDLADEFAASGATINFINNVIINGKSIAEYWKDLSGAEAKSSRFECHIMATSTGVNRIRVGTNVSNGFDGSSEITVTLKKGLVFYGGAYLDHDITLTYTPANGDVPASTTYTSAAETIGLASDKAELIVGETAQLTATVAPADYTGELVYASSDATVASVSAEGVVTALKAGIAKITAKVGNVVSEEVSFNVKNPAATAIDLSADKTELKVSETATLTATVTPDVYDGTLAYEVSDSTIVSVSAEGVVTALKAGTVKITAKIGELVSEEVTITVTEKEEVSTPDESVSTGDSASAAESNGTTESIKTESTGKSGCTGAAGAGLFGVLGIGAAIVALKKKKD